MKQLCIMLMIYTNQYFIADYLFASNENYATMTQCFTFYFQRLTKITTC